MTRKHQLVIGNDFLIFSYQTVFIKDYVWMHYFVSSILLASAMFGIYGRLILNYVKEQFALVVAHLPIL